MHFLLRWDAGWDAGSALPPSAAWIRNLTTARDCWTRSTGFRSLPGSGSPIVVLMGTGEPLDNYENVIKFIRMSQ